MPTLESVAQSALLISLAILLVGILILVVIVILAFRKPNVNNFKELSQHLRNEFEQFHKNKTDVENDPNSESKFNPFKSLISHKEVEKLAAIPHNVAIIHPSETDVRHLEEKDSNLADPTLTTTSTSPTKTKPTLAQIKQNALTQDLKQS